MFCALSSGRNGVRNDLEWHKVTRGERRTSGKGEGSSGVEKVGSSSTCYLSVSLRYWLRFLNSAACQPEAYQGSLLCYGLCYLLGSDITEFVIYAETPQNKKWNWGHLDMNRLVPMDLLNIPIEKAVGSAGIRNIEGSTVLLWVATWCGSTRMDHQPSACSLSS